MKTRAKAKVNGKNTARRTTTLPPGRNVPATAMAEMADMSMRNYQRALRTGQKFQKESTRQLGKVMNQPPPIPDWQKGFSSLAVMATRLIPMAHQRIEAIAGLIEKNNRNLAELVWKAIEAAQAPVPAESQAKWIEVWTFSLRTFRNNLEAITEINNRSIDSYIDFVRRNTETAEIRMPKLAA